MSHGGGGSSEVVEVNLIPMIDIVIQLITFFLMLVNFDDSNRDERVRLPLADLAHPGEMEIEEMLILNVAGTGQINVGLGGDLLLDPDSDAFRVFVAREAAQTAKNMKAANKEVKKVAGRPQLWTTVMIRADRNADSGKVQRMMKVCQEHGFYKFALRASPTKGSM